MEQIEASLAGMNMLDRGFFDHVPLLAAVNSSVPTTNSSAPVALPLPLGWLSCACDDGWGPISPIYNDFSPCFFSGLLFGAAGVVFALAGLYQLKVLRARKVSTGNKVTGVFYLKLLLAGLQIVFSSLLAASYKGPFDILRTAIFINVAATAIIFAIHYVEQFKSKVSSGVLLFFWLLQLIFFAGRVLSLNLRSLVNSSLSTVSILSTVNSLILLNLENIFAPKSLSPFSAEAVLSPFDRANVFSRITFGWMGPLMKKGFNQFLTQKDMPFLPQDQKAANTSALFYKNWNSQVTPSLFWAIAKSFGLPFLIGGVFKGLQDALAFAQPQLLRMLIRFVNDYTESVEKGDPLPLTRGVMIAGGMFLVSVVQTTFLHQYFQRAFEMGMQIKSSLTAVIYNKSLVLSNETKQETNTGDIVNLMSVDVQRLQDLVQNLQMFWSGPFQIVLCLYSLHGFLGNSMWGGVAIMVIMIPLNGVIARYQKKLQKTQMKYKDERTRLISEILNNIKSLKLYGWEHPYLKKLNHVRNDKELHNLRFMGIFGAASNFSWNLAPFLVSCCTFGIFVLTQKDVSLSTDIVFPALSLFNLLSFPLAVVPMVITNVVEAQVAVSRLTKFLTASELQDNAVIRAPRVEKIGDVAVSVENGTFLWSKLKGEEAYKVSLSNINMEAKKGELDCIVGKVGSGKSSIIQAILGDLYKLDGEVTTHGKIAYASQVPWILNGTVRENVLFGHKYDAEFYQHVLNACALSIDLKILPKGDKTEVGEKGISLSGGQKARLALARAVYARADVYLFDDPLSAVDEHVGRHLIDHVFGPNGMLKSKCRILATNSINVLNYANNVHMVKDGKIVEQGSYLEIMSQAKSQLRQLIIDFGKGKSSSTVTSSSASSTKKETSEELKDNIDYTDLNSESDVEVSSLRRASMAPIITDEERLLLEQQEDEDEDEDTKARREHAEQGKVKWDVYKEYAKACSPFNVAVFLGATVTSMLVNVGSNVWLKHWSEVNTRYGYNPDPVAYLSIYLAMGLGFSLCSLVQTCYMWIYCTIRGSAIMHDGMAKSVLRAPMSFFETTPIGRILNRFSNDIYKIDEILGRVFGMFFSNSVKVLFTIAVICFSTWQFIFIVVPLGVLYVYYQQYFLRTSRELRRLDSVSRSPIFANFQESLNGVSVIRAYGQEERFKHLNIGRVDKNMRAYHPAVNANRWLAVRLEFLGSIIILGASGFAILSLKSGTVSAGLVGLSVSYALQVTQSLNWIVRMTVEVESNIVSVERVLEYTRLQPEAPEVIEDYRPPVSWPAEGEVIFKDYSTRYRPELELVLKNINLSVKPHEKIGIVGRTGAGKSSLTLALFRIIEASSGHIEVDNLDTSKLGLSDLRHKLSIIPQDAQVFEGSIRSNLDPTECFSDEEIWKALELSHLKDHVWKLYDERDQNDESIKSGLDAKVSEGGSNLSVGQRQLMCLARALLIPSHILVLDEATAAVDVETDAVLQETIRKEFKDRTILTIAHRLNTILDSDKIIVLEKGEVAEFDTPENLLRNKDSLYYALCKQGGFIEDENEGE